MSAVKCRPPLSPGSNARERDRKEAAQGRGRQSARESRPRESRARTQSVAERDLNPEALVQV